MIEGSYVNVVLMRFSDRWLNIRRVVSLNVTARGCMVWLAWCCAWNRGLDWGMRSVSEARKGQAVACCTSLIDGVVNWKRHGLKLEA